MRELSAKPASQKLLEQARVESGQRFGLKDLLNVPMQRVLKYPLLLKVRTHLGPDSLSCVESEAQCCWDT